MLVLFELHKNVNLHRDVHSIIVFPILMAKVRPTEFTRRRTSRSQRAIPPQKARPDAYRLRVLLCRLLWTGCCGCKSFFQVLYLEPKVAGRTGLETLLQLVATVVAVRVAVETTRKQSLGLQLRVIKQHAGLIIALKYPGDNM